MKMLAVICDAFEADRILLLDSVFYSLQGKITVNQSLCALEECLGGDPFLRCYRYFIVNMNFAKRLNEDNFLMKDGYTVWPICPQKLIHDLQTDGKVMGWKH